MKNRFHIVEMTKTHSNAIAKLHCDTIKTGFTAWLGHRFCNRLYLAMSSSPYSFVLVYEDEHNQPLGFICGATNTSKMYKSIILRHFFPLALSAIGKLLRPLVIKRVLSAIRRPKMFKTEAFSAWELPEAEIVSIGVHPDAQGKHIGTKLLQAAFIRFRTLGHNKVRVWTIEENKQATIFYQKRGFALLGERQHHSGTIYVFVADLNTENTSGHGV